MAKSVEELISLAKGRLTFKSPFFASLLLSMPIVEETDENVTHMKTGYTNGKKIAYFKDFINEIFNDDGLDAVVAFLLHETIHAAFGHIYRGKNRHPFVWNWAADLVTNDIIEKVGGRIPPKFKLKVLLDTSVSYSEMSVEEVYNKLCEKMDEMAKNGQTSKDGIPWPMPNGSGDNNNSGNRSMDDHSPWAAAQNGADADNQAEKWKCKTAAAARAEKERLERHPHNRGTLPAWLQRIIEDVDTSKIDWRKVLANFIQPTRADYSWNPSDRRLLGSDIILPDISGDSLEDVVIAVDTSGSIDQAMLKEFISEVLGIIQMWPSMRGYFVTCDAQIASFQGIDESTTVDELEIGGGGGTDFVPVFNEVEERNIRPSALVYLTDTFGRYAEEEPDYPVMWCVPECYAKNMNTPPYGMVLIIPDDN